jgi:hypothetical protein
MSGSSRAAVSGSPFVFTVTNAEPSATHSRHNLQLGSTRVDTREATTLELTAFALDEYENACPLAEGLAVSVSGGDQFSTFGEETIALEAPRFTHTLAFAKDEEVEYSIVFTLNYEQVGEPAIVVAEIHEFESALSPTNVYVGVAAVGVGGIVVFLLVNRLKKRSSSASLKTKNREVFELWGGLMANLADPLTDFLNWYGMMCAASPCNRSPSPQVRRDPLVPRSHRERDVRRPHRRQLDMRLVHRECLRQATMVPAQTHGEGGGVRGAGLSPRVCGAHRQVLGGAT